MVMLLFVLVLAFQDRLHPLKGKVQDFADKDPAFVGQYSDLLSQ